MPSEPIRMNRNDLLALHKQMCDNAHGIMQRKNADYSGQKGADPFANFRRCEAMGICSTEAGTLTRMCDKMSRLSSFVERGELSVKEESVRDTCEDLINYSILLYGILAEKHGWLDGNSIVATQVKVNGEVVSEETIQRLGVGLWEPNKGLWAEETAEDRDRRRMLGYPDSFT